MRHLTQLDTRTSYEPPLALKSNGNSPQFRIRAAKHEPAGLHHAQSQLVHSRHLVDVYADDRIEANAAPMPNCA